ncbi:MAG: YkvA family protein [Thermodesulfobacteriota bacterium]
MTDNFDEGGFWEKVKRFAQQAGREVIEKALWLYYAAQEAETPRWAKTVIYGALAYFILPVDAIPDAIPAAGYTDDLGALAAAIATVSMYVTEDVKQKAARKMSGWFN